MSRTTGSYANRGRPFEDLLAAVHARYQATGRACVHKVPTEFLPLRNGSGQIVSCKVEQKSCVDYLGRFDDLPVAVEAKHTQASRIAFDRVEPHQADYLDDFCQNPRAIGLVVVSFGMRRFFAVPWPFWRAARSAWAARGPRGASVPVSAYGMVWDMPGKASVSATEMHPDWEITPKGPYLLPYLQIIERLGGQINGK